MIDGWEATRRLKAAPDTRAIPIIALTALAMASDERKARDAGCDDFDTKPVDLPRLLEKVERWLGERPRRVSDAAEDAATEIGAARRAANDSATCWPSSSGLRACRPRPDDARSTCASPPRKS